MTILNDAVSVRVGADEALAVYVDGQQVWSAVPPGPPANTVLPAVTGAAVAGSLLTCSPGTWTGAGPITYSYNWKRNGVTIPGAGSGPTYTSDPEADIGATISCTVTATNAYGSTPANSAGGIVVTAPPITFHLDDQFTTAAAAPIPNPRTAEPGPGVLRYTDTLAGESPSIAGGRWVMPRPSTGAAWTAATLFQEAAVERKGGLAFYFKLHFTVLDRAELGVDATVDGANMTSTGQTGGWAFDNTASWSWQPPGVSVQSGGGAPDYELVMIARSTGYLWLIKGGVFASWTLLHVSAKLPSHWLHLVLANLQTSWEIDRVAVLEKTGALARDFDRATFFDPLPASGQTAEGGADGCEYISLNMAAGQTHEHSFRYVDDNNRYRLVCDYDAGTIKLYRHVAGVVTELDPGKTQAWTNLMYRVGIMRAGAGIRVEVEQSTGSVNTSATKHNFVDGSPNHLAEATSKLGGNANIANWEIWPRTLAGGSVETLA